MAPQIKLKAMPVDKLMELRRQVDAALSTKVAEQRGALESKLAELDRIHGGSGRRSRGNARGAGSKIEPKYRNPDNPSETWAGRGLTPRWLTAAIKAGRKLEDFSIEPSSPKRKRTVVSKPSK